MNPPRHTVRRSLARRFATPTLSKSSRSPLGDRKAKLNVQNLEDRVVPSAPAPPPGFTATTTAFTNNTQVLISSSGTPSYTSTINVSGAGTYLHDVDLTTFIKHTFGGDLDITLVSPAGTAVTITSDNGSSFDDVFNGTLWDDDNDPGNPVPFSADTFAASKIVTDTVYANLVVQPNLTPEEPLGAFIGENPNGTWTLTISDDATGDGGSLDQWKLDITTLDLPISPTASQTFTDSPGSAIGPAVGVTTATINVSGAPTYLKKLTLFTTIAHTANNNLDITLTSPAGTVVTISSDNGSTNDDGFKGTLWDDDADPGNPAPFPGNTFAASRLVTDTTYTNLIAKPTLTPEEPLSAFIGEDPNGAWTLSISDDLASDGGTLTDWSLNFRGAAPYGTPVASALSLPNVTSFNNGSPSYTFSVKYDDNTAINVSTLINNNNAVRVTGPGGFSALATYVGIDSASNGTPRTVTYSLTPPGGTWDFADNGAYTVAIEPNQVKDTAGNAVVGDAVGTFSVAVLLVTNANDSGTGSLRDMITAANSIPGADTILFDPAAFSSPQTISLLTVLPQISDSLTINGPTAAPLTVRRDPGAGTTFRVFDTTAPFITMTNFTVSGGNFAGDGAGIQAAGVLTLTGMTISGNTTTGSNDGGGISILTGGSLMLRNSVVSGNTSGRNGGGIYFFTNGALFVENSTISGNAANGSPGGGGIYFFGTASPTPPAGFVPSTLVIRNSTINNNTTVGSGGGILLLGTFTGTLLVQNSTIANNTATLSGGGIAQTNGGGSIRVESSTISGNTSTTAVALSGGGGIARTSTTAGSTTILNSVVSLNNNVNGPDILSSSVTTTNVNFSSVFSNTGFTLSGTSADNRPFAENPLLGVLADNGGPTRTMAPQPGSPVINVGSDAGVAAELTTDQRGGSLVRKFGTVDMGSFEVQPPTVTINQRPGQADPTNGSPIDFVVTFNAPVTGFDGTDIDFTGSTVGGTLVANVSGSGANYTVSVTGMNGDGNVVASVAAGAAVDGSLTGNVVSTSTDNTVRFDNVAPTLTIDQGTVQADPTNLSPVVFDVHFAEPVTGFTASDIDFTGSTVGGTLAPIVDDLGNGKDYTVRVTGMTGDGQVVASVVAGAALDLAGNASTASTSTDNSVHFDNVPPTVTIDQGTLQAEPTNGSPITFDVHFSDPVSGFSGSDISFTGSTVGGTLVAGVTDLGNGMDYTVSVSGMTGDGFVVASIPAGGALDAAGNGNLASTSTDNSVHFDGQSPAVTINQAIGQADPTNGSPVTFAVHFNEVVTGFTGSDISFAGSTVGGTLSASVTDTGNGMDYAVAVTGMTGDGQVVASVVAGAADDPLGNPSEASTSTDNSVRFDNVLPTVTINQAVGQADPTKTSPVTFAVHFNEKVTGFTGSDISFAGSTVGGTLVANVTDTGNGIDYTVTVTGMTGDGFVVASIPAGAALDLAGNASTASTSTDNSVRFDNVLPAVTINQAIGQADPTNGSPVTFAVQFSEKVTGFTGADISFAGSTVGGTLSATVTDTGNGIDYTVAVTGMTGDGQVVASIPAGAALDLAGNASTASTSTDNSVHFDNVPPTVTIDQTGGQADPTSSGPIVYDVHFNSAVTGFTGSDVSFAGSTVGGTLVANVIDLGNGMDYTVNVTGMFGLGSVIASIPAGSAVDVANNGNLASTSTDNTVQYDNAGTIKITSTKFNVSEGVAGGKAIITVTRVDGTDGANTISWATADGSALAGLDYTASTDFVTWADGEAGEKTIEIPITNDLLNEGRETITITIAKTSGLAHMGLDTATLTIDPSDPFVLTPTVKSKVFQDFDNDNVTVRLSTPKPKTGPTPTVNVYLTDTDGDGKGQIEWIELIDTDPLKSTVSIGVTKTKLNPGNGRVDVGAITGSGLRSFTGKLADLNMEGINLNGYLGTLTIGNVNGGADITTLAGTSIKQKTRITAGQIGDGTDINIGAPISQLSAIRIGDGTITAPFIGTMQVKGQAKPLVAGDLGADITLSGAGLLPGVPALTGLTVSGSLLSTATITAPVLGNVSVRKDLLGDIVVSGLGVPVGKPAMRNLKVTGAINGADVSVGGNLSLVQAGSIVGSRIYAGYTGPETGVGGTFSPAATIGTVLVTGKAHGFVDSTLAATNFNTVVLNSIDSANVDKFGVLYHTKIGKLKVLGLLLPFNFIPGGPPVQSTGDFEVKLV